jgi:hypothetical protein
MRNKIKILYLSLRERDKRNYKGNTEESLRIKKKRRKESVSSISKIKKVNLLFEKNNEFEITGEISEKTKSVLQLINRTS